MQRHHLSALLQHGRCVEHPVDEVDLLRRPVTGGGVEIVNRPSGRYQNASEVQREGLWLVERREAEDAPRIEALRATVQLGGCTHRRRTLQIFSLQSIAA